MMSQNENSPLDCLKTRGGARHLTCLSIFESFSLIHSIQKTPWRWCEDEDKPKWKSFLAGWSFTAFETERLQTSCNLATVSYWHPNLSISLHKYTEKEDRRWKTATRNADYRRHPTAQSKAVRSQPHCSPPWSRPSRISEGVWVSPQHSRYWIKSGVFRHWIKLWSGPKN